MGIRAFGDARIRVILPRRPLRPTSATRAPSPSSVVRRPSRGRKPRPLSGSESRAPHTRPRFFGLWCFPSDESESERERERERDVALRPVEREKVGRFPARTLGLLSPEQTDARRQQLEHWFAAFLEMPITPKVLQQTYSFLRVPSVAREPVAGARKYPGAIVKTGYLTKLGGNKQGATGILHSVSRSFFKSTTRASACSTRGARASERERETRRRRVSLSLSPQAKSKVPKSTMHRVEYLVTHRLGARIFF